jgi:amino acid efflux transporter
VAETLSHRSRIALAAFPPHSAQPTRKSPALTPQSVTPGHETRAATEAPLSTLRGAALYIGALLGPGLLLLPGLAAAEAGPASLLAWIALLLLSGLFALIFGSLGRSFPSASGVTGYVTTGLGARAGLATGWMFLAAVVAGAPIVCLIGAGYVTALTGGGQVVQAGIAGGLLAVVLTLAAGGLRTSSTAQLLLVGLLVIVIAVAVAGSAGSSHGANWTPFAPHGWLAVGHAATTLMLSFVGWEAVAPLTTRFADPSRQLPRVVGITLAVTTTLYLGLAVAIIGVLGHGAGTLVPLAGLLRIAVGPAGTACAAVAAVVLTLGTTNAYLSGAAAMASALSRPRPANRPSAAPEPNAEPDTDPRRPAPRLLASIAASGFLLITLYGLGLADPASLVAVPTALFLAVYLGCMVAAFRVLRGSARWAAVPAGIAVMVMLGYCGWALTIPVFVAAAVCWRASARQHAR